MYKTIQCNTCQYSEIDVIVQIAYKKNLDL